MSDDTLNARMQAARLVGLWDRWQAVGGPSTGMDIWEWSAQAVNAMRELTKQPRRCGQRTAHVAHGACPGRLA